MLYGYDHKEIIFMHFVCDAESLFKFRKTFVKYLPTLGQPYSGNKQNTFQFPFLNYTLNPPKDDFKKYF